MTETLARSSASAEPPDAIQPQGWLIVCDAAAVKVCRHSANLAALFPSWPGPFIGAPLREMLGPEVTHSLRNALARFATPAPPAMLTGLRFPGCDGVYDMAVHATDQETLIEIEQAPLDGERAVLDRLRAFLARLAQARDLDKTLSSAARLAFAMLQYDRVAVLRLDAQGRGAVVAEQKAADIEARPEGAEPLQRFSEGASAKWLNGRLRLIVDAGAPAAAVVSAAQAGPLDLTQAFLRAAGPDERALLRSSGAVGALTIPLIVEGRLWGLIFCTHRTPRHPAMELRAAAELFGEFVSLRLQILSQRQNAPERMVENVAARPPRALDGLRVLIVEDQALIAMDLEASLAQRGLIVADVCMSSAQAFKALENVKFDAAILDLHLDGETSLALAKVMEKRAIPFIFATGQGEGPSDHADDPKLLTRLAGKALTLKPYDIERVLAALRAVLAAKG